MSPESVRSEDRDRPTGRVRASVALGVLFALIAAYYVIHKPFDASMAQALTLDGLRLLLAGALVLVAGAAGLRLVGPLPLAASAQAAVYAAVGLGLSGVLWLLIGAVIGFKGWLSWLVLLAALAVLRRSALAWLRVVRSGWFELRPKGGFEVALAVAVAALLAMALLESLGPPVSFDALVYHLSLPRTFLNAGRVVFDPANPFWGSPLLVEMNNTWAMSVAGDVAATILGVLTGGLALMGVFGLVSYHTPRGAWVAVASLMVGRTLWSSFSWGYVDWHAALFGLAIIAFLEVWRRERKLSYAVWAGVLAGFAMGTKYTAGVALGAGLAAILIVGEGVNRLRATLRFLAAALAAFAAWPLKNLIATGTPLYPYWGANPWVSAAQQTFFSGVSSVGFHPVGPLIPLFATLYGVEGAPGYAASIGPLLLGLSLAALIGPIRRREWSGFLTTFVVAGWLLWGGANLASELLGQSRLYMVIFPAWAALAGLGYAGLRSVRLGSVRLGRLTQALVLMTTVFALASAFRSLAKDHPLLPVLGLESREQTLARRLGAYAPAMAAVRESGDSGSVVMLWEPRGYYCQPECVSDAWIDRWYALRRAGLDETAILQRWRADGRSYVLLNRIGMAFVRDEDPRYTPQDWAALDDLLGRMDLVQSFGDSYVLYALP
ncbi:MAG: hypothetical protein WBZ24_08145 [Anaerolineales bacterium]